MHFLPVSINIDNEQILIIGGGKVALHKIEGLQRFSHNIKIISPEIIPAIKELGWVTTQEKHYEPSDLAGHLIVYAATNNNKLNSQIKADAKKQRCLVNVVDNPYNCDFISPAIYKNERMTVAVSSNGENVHASIQWRNEIKKLVENGTINPIKKKEKYIFY